MPTSTVTLSVFVASSSDVRDERRAAEAEIGRLNERLIRRNLTVHCLNYEDGAVPDWGTDPQDVINRQVNFAGVDIFLGILWRRAGTPTPRGSCGMAEELQRALQSRMSFQRPARIMFFLCDRPYRPTTPDDVFQWQRAQQLRREVSSQALCETYSSVEDFRYRLMHKLSIVVDEMTAAPPPQQPMQPQPQPAMAFNVRPSMMGPAFVWIGCPSCGGFGDVLAMYYFPYRGTVVPCQRCFRPHFLP